MGTRKMLGRGVIVPPTKVENAPVEPAVAASVLQTALTDARTNPQQQLGPTGIKYPFRFSNGGRVAVSTTNTRDASHIKESIEQILFTKFRERFFLPLFGSPVASLLFEPQEVFIAQTEAQVMETLEIWERRIAVNSVDMSIDHYENRVLIEINYDITITAPQINVSQIISVDL